MKKTIFAERCSAPAVKAAGNDNGNKICGVKCLLLTLALASMAGRAHGQDGFNILANDYDRQFKPTIMFSDSNSERVRAVRREGRVQYEKAAMPERLSALVVANLVEFPFSEIAEDMPVSVTMGGFSFRAVLGDDESRKRDRAGRVLPFDPLKKSALFYFKVEVPADGNGTRTKRVGYVKFIWNLNRVKARVMVLDVNKANVNGIYDTNALLTAAALDPLVGGTGRFWNEPVGTSLTFGSAVGTRLAFGTGRVRSVPRLVGSAKEGNAALLALNSLVVAGKADTVEPIVAARVPVVDEDGNGKISFNGVITDLSPGSLTVPPAPVTLRVFIDGAEKFSDTDAPDFSLSATAPDPKGRTTFTVTDLMLPIGDPSKHTLTIYAEDVSGNVTLIDKEVLGGGLSY